MLGGEQVDASSGRSRRARTRRWAPVFHHLLAVASLQSQELPVDFCQLYMLTVRVRRVNHHCSQPAGGAFLRIAHPKFL